MDSKGSQTKFICGTIWENSSSVVRSTHKTLCEKHTLMLLTTSKGLFVIQLMLITCVRSGISDLHAMP